MGLDMDRAQRLVVGAVLPLLYLAAWLVPLALFASDLPDPIAIHFDGSGAADGSASVWVHAVVMGLFVVIASLILVWAAWRPSSTLGIEAAIATFMGNIGAIVGVQVVLANRGLDRWQEATLGAGAVWGAVLGSLGAAIPVALMVRHAVRGDGGGDTPAVVLAPGERAVWVGRSSSWQFGAGAIFLVFLGTVVVIGFDGGGLSTAIPLLLAGLAIVAFMSVTVSVSEAGVSVRGGALRWPVVSFPLHEIEAARHVADFHPLRDGGRLRGAPGAKRSRFLGVQAVGWGYRGSLRLFGAAAWVLGRGPALELDLVDGKRFLVTVDGADRAAALVNGLLARPVEGRD